MTKIGGRVSNTYYSLLLVETYGHDSKGANQRPLRRTLEFWGRRLPKAVYTNGCNLRYVVQSTKRGLLSSMDTD